MKTRPILFNGEMVRAILDGSKTQTRRIVKPQRHPFGEVLSADEVAAQVSEQTCAMRCPYGKPGDHLWVRETFQHSNYPLGPLSEDCDIYYRADYWDDPHGFDGEKSPEGKYRYWNPSIHMPRKYSRITLEVTDVRIERLNDISETDAIAEGIISVRTGEWDRKNFLQWKVLFDAACAEGRVPPLGPTPKQAYRALWESINGVGSWGQNPWVWVVEFKIAKETV